jgi:uncharacterized protein (DUF4415 family)
MSGKITVRKLGDVRGDMTDWARFDAITDEELEKAIAADPDSDVDVDWSTARLVLPERKQSVHLRVDPEVLAWFKAQGKGYLTRMNAVLKSYYKAKSARGRRKTAAKHTPAAKPKRAAQRA